MNSGGNMTKLILVGLGAMVLYGELGPMGLIMLGVALMLMSK